MTETDADFYGFICKFGLLMWNLKLEIMNKVWLFIAALLAATVGGQAQGYEISIKAPGFAGQQAILGEHFTTRMIPKDTVMLDARGEGAFASDSAFKGGMYILYFDPDSYFDFLMADDQHFTIETDRSDFTTNTRFRGSEDNTVFFRYKRFLAERRKTMETLQKKLERAETESDSLETREAIDELNSEMAGYAEKVMDNHPDLFVSTFMEAMKDVELPDTLLEDVPEAHRDSVRFYYYRDHYFDHFDFTDPRLLHTPVYDSKIKTYLSRAVIQHPDSLIRTVDFLMEGARSDPEIFRYMLITLFNHFADSKRMGMDKVYFYIAREYYIPEATWSSPDFIKKLKENLEASKYTFVGDPAPNFVLKEIPSEHFQLAAMDTSIKKDPHVGSEFLLYEEQAPYTILYFWEVDCGHCSKSTPKLYEVFKKYEERGLRVMAVHVINSVEGKEKWVDFINEHELYDWTNCWSPYSNDFRKLYNLNSFPQLFLLDEEKKIVGKQLTPEQAGDILERFLPEE